MRVRSIQLTGPLGDRTVRWRPILSVLLAALLLAISSIFWASFAHADDDDDGGGEAVPRQIVVKLEPGVEIGTINNDERYRTTTIEKLLGSRSIYLLKVPKSKNPARVLELMQNDGRLIYAEPNFRTEAPEGDARTRAHPGGTPVPSSDSAPYSNQYAIQNLNLPAAHQITRGAGSVVAVLDTGVQPKHPTLADNLTQARYDFIGDDRVPADAPNGLDDNNDGEVDETVGHGTHVAGIVRLAAPRARIMPLRTLNSDGRGDVFVLAEAISYAARNGADVVNLSLGASRQSDFLDDIFENAIEGEEGLSGGTVIVASAGNENTSARRYPAAEEDVLAITSVDEERSKSSFANYGGWVDAAAPGSNVYSTFPRSRYSLWSGTSMATPFVSGQAALLYDRVPMAGADDDRGEYRVECITGTIRNSAQALGDTSLGNKGHADAAASLNYLKSNGCRTGDGDD